MCRLEFSSYLLLTFRQKRGAVLGALSTTNTAFQPPLELKESLGLHSSIPASPYVRRQAELVDYAKGLQSIAIPAQLKVNEAASLYDLWQQDKALNDRAFPCLISC